MQYSKLCMIIAKGEAVLVMVSLTNPNSMTSRLLYAAMFFSVFHAQASRSFAVTRSNAAIPASDTKQEPKSVAGTPPILRPETRVGVFWLC